MDNKNKSQDNEWRVSLRDLLAAFIWYSMKKSEEKEKNKEEEI